MIEFQGTNGDPKKIDDLLRRMCDEMKALRGVGGQPIALFGPIDMQGNPVMNLGAPTTTADALSQAHADPMYSQAVQQSTMEAVGTKMLQTTRRLNDGRQQHKTSGDLKQQGTIPPTILGQTTYSSPIPGTTITLSPPATIQWGDQSFTAIPNVPIAVSGLTGSTPYMFYPYYDTELGMFTFVSDPVNAVGTPPIAFPAGAPTSALTNAVQVQNYDGHVPLSNGAVTATTGSGGGGSTGGGGGSNCIRIGMLVDHQHKGIIPIETVQPGDWIRSRTGWTKVTRKQLNAAKNFVGILLSNGDSVQVTSSHPFPLFGGGEIKAGELSLLHLLVGLVNGDEVPLQIKELRQLEQASFAVMLSCEPDHEFIVGGIRPGLIAHNIIPKK